jgi:hypothetical protein
MAQTTLGLKRKADKLPGPLLVQLLAQDDSLFASPNRPGKQDAGQHCNHQASATL